MRLKLEQISGNGVLAFLFNKPINFTVVKANVLRETLYTVHTSAGVTSVLILNTRISIL